ncbi:MAG: flagellar motor switch protein FliN [Candidatus Kapabacteria bacterium]|nr:flagellar motor switch protein FliN [Ignavibacteriota bacterium]MCW5885259.1 flagellar motor switch protein FliN [Candidatus Kapabacteria bacterium]
MTMTQDEIDALISGGDIDENMPESITADDELIGGEFPSIDSEDESKLFSPLDPKLELLYDLQLPVSIELGRTNMLIRDILRLGRGSVIEFDKLVSEPVDVLINGKKVAEGEVVVIDKHFGIRITTLIDPADRLRTIRK